MKGILVTDLESLIKKNNFLVSELDETSKKISSNCTVLLELLDEITFKNFKSRVNQNLIQFGNIKLRLNSYNQVLNNVLNGYKLQAATVANISLVQNNSDVNRGGN